MSDITVVVPRWFRILIIGQLCFNAVMWIVFMFIVITANIRTENLQERVKHISNVELELLTSKIQKLDSRVNKLDGGEEK